MKLFLLSLITLSSLSIYGQNKMMGYKHTSYYSGGSTFNDSLKYNYNSWEGAFNSFEPTLQFNGIVLKYDVPPFFVHCSSEIKIAGFTGNTTQFNTNNVLTNGLVTQSQGANPNSRVVFQYDANYNLLSETIENYTAANGWNPTSITVYSYDALGNVLTIIDSLGYATTPYQYSADSMWYVPGTNQLAKKTSYFHNFGNTAMDPTYKSEIIYAAGNIDYIDNFSYQITGGVWNWTARHLYTYTGIAIDGFKSHQVASNVVNPVHYAEGTFTYTSLNQPYEFIYSDGQGQPAFKEVFAYSADGFLKTKKRYEYNTPGTPTLTENETYYFSSVLDIEELKEIEVSIFPNPTTETLQILSEGNILDLQLYNMKGQLLIQQSTNTVDISRLEAGIYLLKGKTDLGSFSQKIIKL